MSALPFTPRLVPMKYQASYLTERGKQEYWGLFWDQGTGKTKALIDNAALLLDSGLINGSFILGPNGVHRNWVVEELPKHWPDDGKLPYLAFEWNTSKASGKRYNEEFHEFLRLTEPGPNQRWIGFLCMSYDGLMTDAGKQASWDFLRKREAFYAADESQRFKEPSSKRNRRVFASSAYAPFRRIASGTPMDKPFDIYPQMRFLDEDFWKKKAGIDSFTAFKAHHGNWRKLTVNNGTKIDVLDNRNPYRNLDELRGILAGASTRLTEEQAELELPQRYWHRVEHDLSSEQRAAYEELVEECMTTLSDGTLVTAEHVLTMRLRLMQIGAGFIVPSAGAEPIPFSPNPRRDAITELLYQFGPGEPSIVWCMFRHDYASIVQASQRAGRRPVVYDAAQPEATLDAWKSGQYTDLIGNLGSGLVEGHTLVRARKAVYYTNTPRLIARAQSEKRPHRIGQTREVDYYDMIARGTQDRANLEMVRRKGFWTGEVLGDDPELAKRWMRATMRGEEFEVDRWATREAQAEAFKRDNFLFDSGDAEGFESAF